MVRLSLQYLLRSIGLGILTSIARWVWLASKDSGEEPKKYVKKTSFWVALQRCMVHLLPSVSSIAIIALNMKGFFIGFELAGIPGHDTESIAALQVTAKLQELLIVASVATVLAHKLRRDMLQEQGVPFGLLGSGLSFTELSFLWSPEFLVGVRSAKHNRTLYLLILLSALIAAFAGPATAVLLIPSVIEYKAGHAYYYVNGTNDVLWPSVIKMDHYLSNYTNTFNESVQCSSNNGYRNALCPAGGFSSLLQHFSANTLQTRAGTPILDTNPSRLFSHTVRGGVIVQSPYGQVPAQTISGLVRGEDITETFAYGTHGAITSLQMPLNKNWVLAAENAKNMYVDSRQISRFRFYAVQQSTVVSHIPAVRVTCLGQQVAVGSSTIAFPAQPEFGVSIDTNGTVLHNHTISMNGSLDERNSANFSHNWSDISSLIPANESISQAFMLSAPWYGNGSRPVVACSIDARWADATIWQRFPGPFQASFANVRAATNGFRSTSFLPVNDGSWRRIQFDKSWISAVDFPFNASSAGATFLNQTSISTLLTQSGLLDTIVSLDATAVALLEHILATSLSDALSRVSSHLSYSTAPDTRIADWSLLNYNSTPTAPDILAWSRAIVPADYTENAANYTKVHMQQTVTGFGYDASGSADYLSILLLLAHLVLAMSHTVYVLGFTHRTSGCWDTFSEFMVLAQQSEPTTRILRNTCAGIKRAELFGNSVRIRVSDLDDRHLELEFDGHHFEKAPFHNEIDFKEKYG